MVPVGSPVIIKRRMSSVGSTRFKVIIFSFWSSVLNEVSKCQSVAVVRHCDRLRFEIVDYSIVRKLLTFTKN